MKKMNTLSVLSIALLFAICGLNVNAKLGSPDKVRYAGDLAYKNFCEAVVKDDVNMFKRSVKDKVGLIANTSQAVLKKLTASNGIECNGADLVSFSEQRKASQVYQYLSNAK